jgi:hypothetical protein
LSFLLCCLANYEHSEADTSIRTYNAQFQKWQFILEMYYAEDVWCYSIFSAKGDKPGYIYNRIKAIILKCAYLAH